MFTKDHSNISPIHRRSFLQTSGLGIGAAALQSMLLKDSLGSRPGVSGLPDLPFKAKRVIFLCMAGGPSHLETFDYKPKLDELHGKPMPESFTKGQPIAQLRGQQLKVQGHMTKFNRHGENGQLISDYLPWTAKMADDICIINSMLTEQINHDPAHTFMNTGTGISGRPSMGSWINYGLGSESDELPGFVVLTSVGGRNPQPIASRQWGAGFLPGRFQGVEFSSTGDPVNYLKNPGNVSEQNQRHVVDAIKSLDQKRNKILQEDDILTRISAYEMAFKMQTSVPELSLIHI